VTSSTSGTKMGTTMPYTRVSVKTAKLTTNSTELGDFLNDANDIVRSIQISGMHSRQVGR